MEKAPKLYFVGMLTEVKKDVNGNDYITALVHNGNIDEDGCVVEPLIAEMLINSGITPVLFVHAMSGKTDHDKAIDRNGKDAVLFDKVQCPEGVKLDLTKHYVQTRGLVSRLAMDEFFIVDANGVRVQKDGEDRVGKFITVAVLGNTKDEVAAATVAAYEDRFAYYEEKGLFVDADANAKPSIKTMIDAK